MEETISLENMFDVIKKSLPLILSAMMIGLGVAAIMTFFIMTPKYNSSSQMLTKIAQGENNTVNVGDVNSNLMLINTYKDIIKSNLVLDESSDRLNEMGYDTTPTSIGNTISVAQAPNSQMFTVSATSDNPKIAAETANVVTEVFKDKALEVIDVDKITILALATEPTKPVSPNNKLNLLIGAVLGLMIGLGLVLAGELFDKTVKDDKYISEELGITILGAVSEMTEKELQNKIQAKTATSENLRRSRSRV